MKKVFPKLATLAIFLLGSSLNLFAEVMQKTDISSILEVQQYNRAIHIMAMLLVGFGFLMVFVMTLPISFFADFTWWHIRK